MSANPLENYKTLIWSKLFEIAMADNPNPDVDPEQNQEDTVIEDLRRDRPDVARIVFELNQTVGHGNVGAVFNEDLRDPEGNKTRIKYLSVFGKLLGVQTCEIFVDEIRPIGWQKSRVLSSPLLISGPPRESNGEQCSPKTPTKLVVLG